MSVERWPVNTVRVCTECGVLAEFAAGEEPIGVCKRCMDILKRTECRSEMCTSRRAPGFQFCNRCLDAGAVLLPADGWFNQFLQGSKVPQAAFERMCPEAQVEIEREFARKTTLKHVELNRWPRINWDWVRHQARTLANAAAMGVLMMLAALAAWGLLVLVLGFAPGNEGVTFGGVR